MMSRNLFRLACAAAALLGCVAAAGAGEVKLARHPDYHDGKIVFSYLGDLWLVNDDGANPRRLTDHRALDSFPRFSPDGKWIAFSSSRYGNMDVFVVPVEGGRAKRLTYHSAPDTVVGWSRDSKKVIFQSSRGLLFPGIPNLYEVAVDGGLEQPLPTDWGYWGSYSPDGRKFAFNRHPAPWSRKHYRGSYCADLWVMDVGARSFRRILDNDLPDDQKPNNLWPMYASGEIYFVSDRAIMAKAGSKEVMASKNNIWKVAEEGGPPTQVTHHTSGSLFWPSLSADGKTIVYEENFGLWKLDVASGRTTEVKINIISDEKENNFETLTQSDCESFGLSPSSKRAVISTHGELFTIATERGDARRLTNTPDARDVQPRWSPDGKWIAFVSDKSGREEIWLCDENGANLKKISNEDSEKGQLTWAPDSQSLLYTGSDKKLYKYSLAAGTAQVLTTGSVVGFGGQAISNPQWSPDGKWVSFSKAGAELLQHVYVVPAEGGPERRITSPETYSDTNAHWAGDGKHIVYLSGADIQNIGQAGRSTSQLYAVSLTAQEKDPADQSIDSEAQALAAERTGTGRGPGMGARRGSPDSAAGQTAGLPPRTNPARVEVRIDWEGITRRSRQLTRSEDSIGGIATSPDGQSVIFSTFGTEGGRRVQSLWSIGINGDRLTRLVQSGQAVAEDEGPRRGFGGFGGFAQLQFARDGRTLYYLQGGGIYAVSVGGGAGAAAPTTPMVAAGGGGRRGGRGGGGAAAAVPAAESGSQARRINFSVRVEVDHRAERRQVFGEAWRIMKDRFYDPAMHGVDWNQAKSTYAALVEYVDDQDDFHDLLAMMIGELNASHTGVSGGRGRGADTSPQTRHPGFEVVADPSGYYKVSLVYKGGPADREYLKIKPGDYVLALEGKDLKVPENYWKNYSEAVGSRFEFLVNSKPSKEGAWTVRVTPISTMQVGNLQYDKWVADRRAMVDKLSNGEIGYLHIRQMNEPSLRQFERDLAMLHTKKAVVIDQRFNPGGGIDQELLEILQQRQYQYTKVRDSVTVTRPLRGFFGPKVVMENERSTSDAEVFPDGFRTLKLGKVVGVTTYGAVIGTGSYTLMDGSQIRTPGSGLWNVNGTNLENYGVPPDVYVDNTPEDFQKGKDAQLEKAVAVLQEELKKQ